MPLYMYNDNSILFKIQTVSYCQLVMQKLYKGFYPWLQSAAVLFDFYTAGVVATKTQIRTLKRAFVITKMTY